jgi:XTP/dITP diphosphohydrolase
VLNGDPGVYTADWAGPTRDFAHAMQRVEDALAATGATGSKERRGSFNATLCLAQPDGQDWLFIGKVDGTLVWPPRGTLGHGYDPMFMPDGHAITFGEMTGAQKHGFVRGERGLSHRARAFANFVEAVLEP